MKSETDHLTASLISDDHPPPPAAPTDQYLQKLPTINGTNCI